MGKFESNIDSYIQNAQPFAIPILELLRDTIHEVNPEVTEVIKWGMPSFDYKGPYCSMASFKHHVTFGFWKSILIDDTYGYLNDGRIVENKAMSNFGKITSLQTLPTKNILVDYLKQAKSLNDNQIKLPPRIKKEKIELIFPEPFIEALNKNKEALTIFEKMSYSHQKEYIEWISEAKQEKTKDSRILKAVELILNGKSKHWKYN